MTQTRDNRRSCRTGSEVLTLAAIGGLGLAAIIGTAASPFAGTNIGPEPKAATLIAKPTPARPGMADLVDRVGPSVVTIRTRQAAQSAPEAPPSMEEFFRRFFGEDGARQFRDTPPQPAPQSPDAQSLGSGFIIDRKGHIVTNNHVIGKAGEITVVLKDGKELKAKLVGRDAKTDLALIKVNAGHDLPFVSFGPSAKLRVGQWVMAMGNPFGLGQTVTAGIISARHRTIGAGPFDDFLQIDAAINQGNSGGPAFNLQGQVIGVNTAIFSPSGGNVGIGFAIPSDLVKGVIDDLMDDGKVARGLLGVQIQAVTPELAGILGLDKPKGALISNVTPKGPAAKAGFKRGDV
ncbi:MAG: trypsin-like peptidase domain-containing protein, partial [Rhodospirillales bacterium]|nr:trypsin-like peptidase domain-containing protein [Rhodospirillales bacterium]